VLENRLDGDWAQDLSDSLGTFYGAVAAEPNLAELLLVHSFALGLGSDGHGMEGAVADLSAIIAKGRGAGAEGAPTPGPLSDETFARAALSLASQALVRGEASELPDRAPEVATVIASAYLTVSEVAPILPRRRRATPCV
jgi:hypothetical protein